MTEQEYIDATDLAKVRNMKTILLDITQANSSVIIPADYATVYRIISKWEDDLVKNLIVEL